MTKTYQEDITIVTFRFQAINSVKFNSIQTTIPLADTLLPFCLNLSPNTISNQTTYDARLKV